MKQLAELPGALGFDPYSQVTSQPPADLLPEYAQFNSA